MRQLTAWTESTVSEEWVPLTNESFVMTLNVHMLGGQQGQIQEPAKKVLCTYTMSKCQFYTIFVKNK